MTPEAALEAQLAFIRLARQYHDAFKANSDPEFEYEVEGWGLMHDIAITADTYFWGSDMITLAESAATEDLDSVYIAEDLPPSRTGFVFLERPLETADGMVALFGWGPTMGKQDAHQHAFTVFSRNTMGQTGASDVLMNQSLKAHFDSIEEEVDRFPLRAVVASWLLAKQSITAESAYRGSRAIRRRLDPAMAHEPIIKVIKLRRVEHSRHEGDGEGHEYHVRWMVRGHWRQQWYPSLQRNQPLWISPYIKGPDDAPLKKPSTTVFAVVR